MRIRTLAFIFVLGIFSGARLYADSGSAATAFQSLKFERGARASAMAGAYVATAQGVDSLFWNPAGLSGLRRLELFASHQAWIADISDQQIAIAQPWYGVGAWGAALTYVSTELEGRDDFGQPTGSFSGSDLTGQVSLELDVTRRLGMGVTYRVMRQSYGERFGLGSAFDVGFQFSRLWGRRLTLGLAALNMGTDVSLGSSLGPLPWIIKGGVALKLLEKKLILAADAAYEPHTFFARTRLGAEYALVLNDFDAALRAGYVIGPRAEAGGLTGMTLGAGLGTAGFMLDYAWQPVGDFGNSHKFSITYTFD